MAEYTIRELAERYQVQASTLRYYEEVGLLKAVVHNEKQQRVYSEEHIAALDAIQCFKQTGLPLGRIREFFEYSEDLRGHIQEVVDMMTEHEQSIVQKIQELQCGLEHIRHKVRFYEGIQKAIENDTEWPCWDEV